MRARRCLCSSLGLLLVPVLLALSGVSLAAQSGTLTGRVLDLETSRPLATAFIQIQGAQVGGQPTDAQGQFRFTLPAGTYSVVVSLLGYESQRVDGVSISGGETTNLQILLRSQAVLLNPITVSVGGREEKALDAPANVQVVGAELIQERVALTPMEHIRSVPGVDIAQTGLTQGNVVARGFNNVFSGGLLTITDNRYASVPSLRVNVMSFIPTTDLDLDRMEVVLGPGAALYGPNAASGVLHMITSSPIDRPGNSVAVAGGERSVFQTLFRSAHAVSESFGVKVSGQYFQGNDWEYRDPAEVRAAQGSTNPLIGNRDFEARRWGGEARMDWRPTEDSELILNAGLNNSASSIELTGIGAGQAKDWRYSYLQARYRAGGFFSQVFLNQSNAGDTYLLRTGQPIVDKSRMIAAQLQHSLDLGDRQNFVYGLDLQRTEPRTEGTITGRNEDDDNIDEAGVYVHSTTSLADRLDLVAALRSDYHSRLDDLNFSPRVALVFRPADEQNFRITFNRAFSTPSTNNLFLDLLAGRIPVGAVGYDIRTLGVPDGGFSFEDRCTGGVQDLCMRSPFAPGQQLPANGIPLWNGLVNQLVPEALRPALLNPGAAPGDAALVSLLRRFDQERAAQNQNPFVADDGPDGIGSIRSTITNTFEVGYKGIIGGRLLLSADLYSSQVRDFVGPLRVETPTVFYDPASVQAFVLGRLGPLIQGGLVTQEQAAQVIQGLALVPLGTVAPDQSTTSDLILTYRNFGDVDFWGADLAAQFLLSDRVSLRGAYSHVSEDCFLFSGEGGADGGECRSALDIALNAPKNKGSASARFNDVARGLSAEGRVRFTASFPMNSGVFVGTVDGYEVFDLNLSYRLPALPGATASVSGTNIFNRLHRQFIGAPELGRLFLVRLQYDF